MSIKYIGNFTDAMKAYSEEKIERIKKHLDYSMVTVKAKVIGDSTTVEISIDNRVRAKHVGEDFYAIINIVVDKIISQIERYKRVASSDTRIVAKEDEDDGPVIAREKIIILEEMSIDNAIETMNLLGHDFFMYKDIDQKAVCTVYTRADGTYGLLIGR